jgi:hypothetical protein
MIVLSIDPGTEESAYTLIEVNDINKDIKILNKGIVKNAALRLIILQHKNIDFLVIEMVASYGMPVGKDVFETTFWIGRFFELAISQLISAHKIYRRLIKLHLCYSMQAKDSNIRQALIDRFGKTGTKKAPNPVYNDGIVKMKADMWSAFAVGIYFLDTYKNT